METNKNANSSPADAGKSGVSTLKSFRYYDGLTFVTLNNGVTGIVGSSTDFPFPIMLGLKGTSVELTYDWQKKTDKGYDQYRLEWSL